MNPNIHNDFKSFKIENKSNLTISHVNRINMSQFKLIETIGEYKIYGSNSIGYVYVLSSDFFGLASMINLV